MCIYWPKAGLWQIVKSKKGATKQQGYWPHFGTSVGIEKRIRHSLPWLRTSICRIEELQVTSYCAWYVFLQWAPALVTVREKTMLFWVCIQIIGTESKGVKHWLWIDSVFWGTDSVPWPSVSSLLWNLVLSLSSFSHGSLSPQNRLCISLYKTSLPILSFKTLLQRNCLINNECWSVFDFSHKVIKDNPLCTFKMTES